MVLGENEKRHVTAIAIPVIPRKLIAHTTSKEYYLEGLDSRSRSVLIRLGLE